MKRLQPFFIPFILLFPFVLSCRLLTGQATVAVPSATIAVPSPTVAATTAASSSIQWEALEHDGTARDFGFYASPSLSAPPALVFLLHGGGGSASKAWKQEQGKDWKELADQDGFLLIFPQGMPDSGKQSSYHWNDCREAITAPQLPSTADDVGFILNLIDWAGEKFKIDRQKVYVTGASNGGMMTYRLAMETPEHFAAAAAVIANLPLGDECIESGIPIPMLIMNGTTDPLMPFEGGCVAGDKCRRGRVLSTQETLEYWLALNQVDVIPHVEHLPDIVPEDGSTVTLYSYLGDSKSKPVFYYRIDGGGHNVPGDQQNSALIRSIVGLKNQDIHAPQEIWRFFKMH